MAEARLVWLLSSRVNPRGSGSFKPRRRQTASTSRVGTMHLEPRAVGFVEREVRLTLELCPCRLFPYVAIRPNLSRHSGGWPLHSMGMVSR